MKLFLVYHWGESQPTKLTEWGARIGEREQTAAFTQ
jgi:hypothetical protein